MRRHALFHADTLSAGSRSDDAWADLERKADDLRLLAGGSQDGGSWKTAIGENKTFDHMVELGQPLLTLLDHDQLKGSIRAVHEALDSCGSQHAHPLISGASV